MLKVGFNYKTTDRYSDENIQYYALILYNTFDIIFIRLFLQAFNPYLQGEFLPIAAKKGINIGF